MFRRFWIISKKSRRGQINYNQVRTQQTDGGLDLIELRVPGDEASKLILQHARHVHMIVLGGGDGKINRSLKSVLKVQLPLGILPLGIVNDLARTLQLPTNLRTACEVILAGHKKSIDVGWVNDRRPSLNVASIGFSESVTRRLSQGAKSRSGVLAYIWGPCERCCIIDHSLWELSPPQDAAQRRTTQRWQVAVDNGRNYGGDLTIHKDAGIDDERFDLCSLEIDAAGIFCH